MLPVMYASGVLLLLWELVIRHAETPIYVCPSPSSIWSYCLGQDGGGNARWLSLLEAGQQTLWATVIGFLVAVGLGIGLGMVLASSHLLRKGVYPIANLLQMVPVIALAPLLNIWFGYGIVGVAASATIVSIFPMIANTVDGLRSADPKLRELFELYGATRFQRWRLLDLPSAAPQVFTGMKISAGLSVIGAVVGELVSGVINHPPIGALIAQGLRNSNLPLVFGAVFTSAAIGFLLFGLVTFLESVFVGRWHGMGAKTVVESSTSKASVATVMLLAGVPCLLFAVMTLKPQQSVERVQAQPAAEGRPAPSIVRIQLNWFPEPEFGGFYAAEQLGFFRDEGLDVQLIPGGPGVATPQLAATGSVEFAVVGADQVITTRAQGAPLVAVYAAYQTSPRGIMIHDTAPFTSLEQLWKSNATVAVEAGLPFVKWLQNRYGGQQLTLIPSGGGLAAFQQKNALAQAVFVFAEPVVMDERDIAVRIFPVADSGYNPYAVVLATNETLLKDHAAIVEKVVRALRKGWAAYLADPKPTNALISTLNKEMSLEAMNLSANRAMSYVQPRHDARLGMMHLDRWTRLIEQLESIDAISGVKPLATECFKNVATSISR